MNNETSTQPAAAEAVPPQATGPRTVAGKAVSSQNARKHDLCSKTLHLSPEEAVEYNGLCERYHSDLQPIGDVEQTLVDEICFNYWRLQQAREAELTIIDRYPTDLRIISLYIRYRTGYERAFYKGLDQIQKRQRDRPKQPLPEPVPLVAAVRSAEPLLDQELQTQIDDHALENRVRGELCLPPLPLPKELRQKAEQFVSQNPGVVADGLRQALKSAA